MNELSKKIQDKRLLKLIHSILRANIQDQDNQIICKQGAPQGGPLSPLLFNIVLDKLDKELEKRGHLFVRYADDCSIYLKSKGAGERVMESISTYIEKEFKLKVNVEKSMVTRPWRLNCLASNFIIRKGLKALLRYTVKALIPTKMKSGQLTAEVNLYAMQERMMRIRHPQLGLGNYLKRSEAKTVFIELGQWIRSRIRLCYWGQWKRIRTRIRQLEG